MGSHPSIIQADSILDCNQDTVTSRGIDREESFGYDLDDYQRTVRSIGALSTDTQDSARYEDSPFPCGNIQFCSDDTGQSDLEVRVTVKQKHVLECIACYLPVCQSDETRL